MAAQVFDHHVIEKNLIDNLETEKYTSVYPYLLPGKQGPQQLAKPCLNHEAGCDRPQIHHL